MFLKTLYDTYQTNTEYVGAINKKRNGTEYTLLPVAHSTQVAHIEVCIGFDGKFISAEIVQGEKNTLIPVTEGSSSRTANLSAHPLHDKLMYVAGDFAEYTNDTKRAKGFQVYMQQLYEWCDSPFSTGGIKSVARYLEKGCLIKDLVKSKLLEVDKEGLLMSAWTGDKNEIPPIFTATSNKQSDAFIRFRVKDEIPFWEDRSFVERFIDYRISQIEEKAMCYVLGEELPVSNLQPNKIRSTGDKSKLISAQVKQPLGYLGRFVQSNDAYAISYIASQKAHNALKWLINKQGFNLYGRIFLIWSSQNDGVEGKESGKYLFTDSPQHSILNYFERLENLWTVNVAILDAPNVGRLSLLQYTRFDESEYYRNLIEWQNKCCWLINYVKNSKGEYEEYIGTPSVQNIVSAVGSPASSEEFVKTTTTQVLTTIFNGKKLPDSFIKKAFKNVVGRHRLENWEWEKNLTVTCALINHINEGVEYEVGLDTNNADRDYLFGRLFAVAEVLERTALGDDKRPTLASRYMEQFAQSPAKTWRALQLKMIPYQKSLREGNNRFQLLFEEITEKMDVEAFSPEKNVPLKETFLLGYYHQRKKLYTKKEKEAVIKVGAEAVVESKESD